MSTVRTTKRSSVIKVGKITIRMSADGGVEIWAGEWGTGRLEIPESSLEDLAAAGAEAVKERAFTGIEGDKS